MSSVRRVVSSFGALALVVAIFSLSTPAHATDQTVVTNAIAYLKTQQNPGTTPATGSGAWDSDPNAQFSTTEVVLAIAEAAQTGSTWSTTEAHDAVSATLNPQNESPLPFLDLVAADSTTPGRAAKFVVLVAKPLGLDTTTLASTIGSPAGNGSFADDLHFSDTLFAALAKKLLDGSVPASTVSYIESKQQAAGAWSYDADTTGTTEPDIDTTGLAVQALIAGGVAQTEPAVQHALAWLGSQQNADGTWSFFGDESAESTSRAALAIAAAGYDPDSRCWRDNVDPAAAGQPFVGVDDALASLAHGDGSIAGPNVYSTVYATGQAVQGLERSWLPVARASDVSCTPVSTGPPPSPGSSALTPATVAGDAVVVSPRFTG